MGDVVNMEAYRTRRRINQRYADARPHATKGSCRYCKPGLPCMLHAANVMATVTVSGLKPITREAVERTFRKIAGRERRGDQQLRLV